MSERHGLNGQGTISVREVTKGFDRGKVMALRGVSLEIESGEFVAIAGPSGCGKSTLLHLIAALDRPSSGEVWVNGRNVARMRHADRFRRREIGLVFQLHNLLAHLSARQNVEIPMFGTGTPGRERQRRATELLDAVGLSEQARRRPPELSGGERQRIAVARALANRPGILLADEPTGALDEAAVAGVLKLFDDLRKAAPLTIVLVTHDRDVAGRADRRIEISDGRVRLPAAPGTGSAT